MFIHNEILNPCNKCGSQNKPDLNSDDQIPCWAVTCHDCGQIQHNQQWSYGGAVIAWNKANPITERDRIIEQIACNEFANVGDEGLFPNHNDKDIWISGFKAAFKYLKKK